MITLATERAVLRMLAEGILSKRNIARALGVSRTTVSLIARGHRPELAARRARDMVYFTCNRPPERCHGCGAKVYKPCHACYVQAHIRRTNALKNRAARGDRPAGAYRSVAETRPPS